MEADEAGTLAALKSHCKNLIAPEFAEHHGRIVKLMGDGALGEFASVADSIECAVGIQQGMIERNVKVPECERVELRIGSHADGHKKTFALSKEEEYQARSNRTKSPKSYYRTATEKKSSDGGKVWVWSPWN
jgi:hypothetical protein